MSELKTAVEVALEKLEAREPIPQMIHPLSQYWEQPSRREITVDATHALMSRAAFNKLHEYSMSVPTGVYEGKMWKAELFTGRSETELGWYLRWYGPSPDPDKCACHQRRIIIV